MKKQEFNYDAQEKVVTALWDFIRDNARWSHNAARIEPDGLGDTNASLAAVGDALKTIMAAFGYEVQPVD